MANGDDAAAAGMDVVASTAKAKLGYDEINKTRDYIARRTSAVTPIEKGGTGSATATAARTALGLYSKTEVDAKTWDASRIVTGTLTRPLNCGYGGSVIAGTVSVGTPQGTGGLFVGGTGSGFDGLGNAVAAQLNVSGAILSPYTRLNPVSSNYVAVYVDGGGRFGATPSSRRFKKEIRSWSPELQAVFAMQLVTFRYKAAIYGSGDAPVEVGMIAEELIDLGLDWLVYYDDEGQPAGIHYERVSLALLPAIQNLNERVTRLENGE